MVLQMVIYETSVADLYHFDTDPDSGCEKICYGSGFRVNFDTDPDPGKTIRIWIRIQEKTVRIRIQKKGLSTRKIFKKCMKNANNLCFVGGLLLYNHLSTTNHSNY